MSDEEHGATPEDPHVILVFVDDPRQAIVIAEALQRGGIDAWPRMGEKGHGYCCVVVRESQLTVAEQVLDLSTHAPQGDATREEIEQDLAAHAAAQEPTSPVTRRTPLSWSLLPALLAVLAAAAALSGCP